MKIFIIITILLDLVAILLVSIEDKYLDKKKKIIGILLILFLPIIGALITMYKLGTGSKYSSSNDSGFHGGYSGGSGGGGD